MHCNMFTCDVIWENTAYVKANGVFLDQSFPYIYIHKNDIVLNCAERETSFSADVNIDVIKKSMLRSDAAQSGV